MSRTPIRNALSRLENEGFLKIYSNQGIYFWNPTAEERNELFDLRIAIETYSIQQVSQFSKSVLDYLEQNIRDQYIAIENKDSSTFNELDMDFHQYLLEVNGNSQFIKIYKNCRERLMTIRTARNYLLKNESKAIELVQDHTNILKGLNKDSHRSSIKVLEEHIKKGKVPIY